MSPSSLNPLSGTVRRYELKGFESVASQRGKGVSDCATTLHRDLDEDYNTVSFSEEVLMV